MIYYYVVVRTTRSSGSSKTKEYIMTDINIVEGQQDLFTGEVVEVEETEVTVDEIVNEITTIVFGSDTTISPYKIAKVINKVFEATSTDKVIPPQMMYSYASKGMISKGNKSKEYTFDEVVTYVTKYTNKYV